MKLVIIGAGGHAKVVVDTAQFAGWQVLGFADDNTKAALFGLPHLGKPSDLELPKNVGAIIAIGSNRIRQKLALILSDRFVWATIVHPKAIVSSRATLQIGTVVFAGAVIQADTVIGQHCIVNSSASIDHDCNIANATLTGGVTLETGVFVGAGAVVAPSKHIGAWSTLGAGGVAIKNLQAGATFAGIPAKNLTSS
jgi:sugar O-acyltransferase (sialic acid O-acetyltransferase NeuD family)